MEKNVIAVKNLSKRFKTREGYLTAVDAISFNVNRGEIVGFLGPNGAGKTTTLRMLLTIIIPDSGNIHILSKDVFTHREEVLKQVNFTFVNSTFGSRLTVVEILAFFALLYEVDHVKEKVHELMETFEVTHLKDKRLRELSSGELSRVALCKALVNSPKVLFLDEPTASLDPDMADKTRILIKSIRKKYNTTILYTSHNMHEVEELCDRVLFLHKGKIILSGSPLEITQQVIHESAKEPSLREVFIKISRGEEHEFS